MDFMAKPWMEQITAETAKKISTLNTKNTKKITDYFRSNTSHFLTEQDIEKQLKSLVKDGFLKETSSKYEMTEKAKKTLKNSKKLKKQSRKLFV